MQQRDYHLMYNYGITEAEYEQMKEDQKNCCAICRKKPRTMLLPDHDHETGKLRQLLCYSCNNGLGMFQDDPKLLAYALVYLELHGKKL